MGGSFSSREGGNSGPRGRGGAPSARQVQRQLNQDAALALRLQSEEFARFAGGALQNVGPPPLPPPVYSHACCSKCGLVITVPHNVRVISGKALIRCEGCDTLLSLVHLKRRDEDFDPLSVWISATEALECLPTASQQRGLKLSDVPTGASAGTQLEVRRVRGDVLCDPKTDDDGGCMGGAKLDASLLLPLSDVDLPPAHQDVEAKDEESKRESKEEASGNEEATDGEQDSNAAVAEAEHGEGKDDPESGFDDDVEAKEKDSCLIGDKASVGASVVEADPLLDVECQICLCEFEVGDSVRTLPCGHVFRVGCIDDWLSRQPSCPSCQVSVITGHTR